MPTFLVAGSPEGQRPARLAPGAGDQVIAVDAGLLHARAWGWPVHVLIGDLDSLAEAAPGAPLVTMGIPLITAPTAKDETDLELGLAYALAHGAPAVVLCAALGGRIDHALANVLLLASPQLAGIEAVLADGPWTLRLLRGGETARLPGEPGDLLSLLPIAGDAQGVVTEGLLYPLRDETLRLGQARGVSNVYQANLAGVSLRAGLLVIAHKGGN